MTARTVEDVLLGEAVAGSPSKRLADMIAIASTIRNRAERLGRSADDIIAARGEFSAYGRALPEGVEQYRELARKAWAYVQKAGPTHNATFYATPAAMKNLPEGLKRVAKTAGHVFFTDPQNRAIRTTQGFVRPADSVPPSIPTSATADAAMRMASFPAPHRPSAGMLELTPSLIPRHVDYSPLSAAGKGRNRIPTSGIADKVSAAANSVIPGSTTSLYSGMEPAGRAPVGTPYRHPLGFAGDFDFYAANGQRITNPVALHDIAMEMAARHNANIGYGETGYMGKGRMHIDTMPLDRFPGAPQWGNTAEGPWAGNLDFARQTGMGPTPYTNAPTPSPRPQLVSPLDAAPAGQIERGPLQPAQDRPELVAMAPQRASLPPDRLMPSGPARNGPAGDRKAPPAGPMSDWRRDSTSLPQGSAWASNPMTSAMLSAAEAMGVTPARAAPVSLPPDRPMPSGPVPATSSDIVALAAERRKADVPLQTRPPELTSLLALGPAQSFQPGAPTLPAFVPANAPVPPGLPSAPLNPPRTIMARPVAAYDEGPFPAAPSVPNYRPADVYAGVATSARDAMGNTVSRDAHGTIGITNKHGVTTYSRDGLTTAAGFGGSLGNAQPGEFFGSGAFGGLGDRIDEAFEPKAKLDGRSHFGNAARGLGGAMAGSALGSLAGPFGSLIGAAIGAELSKPGGGKIGDFVNGIRTVNTFDGPMQFARAVGGGPFPSRPQGGGGGGSNLTREQMDKISPKASRDITRGKTGLF